MTFRLLTLRSRVRVLPDLKTQPYGPTITKEQADEIDQWVTTVRAGRKIGHDIWRLKSSSAVTLFKLRWA